MKEIVKGKAQKGISKLDNIDVNSKMFTRIPVQKTYKLYIGGKYPRTESGRYYQLMNEGKLVANVCRSSRKDFRNAVKVARTTFSTDWAKRPAFVRGHILYRMAEMLEYRSVQFIDELVALGYTKTSAKQEVYCSIDRLIYYAGWSDKFQQVFSAVNPTNTSHFNFSVYEPMGIVAIIAPENYGLLGLISSIIPVIIGGNTCIVLPSEKYGSLAITFSEVMHTSDMPAGTVNVLTGFENELALHFASHMDVNAVVYCRENQTIADRIQTECSQNVKRFYQWNFENWLSEKAQNPYFILDTQEVKTTWHPIGF